MDLKNLFQKYHKTIVYFSLCHYIYRMISTLDLYVMRFNEYGKNFPKSQNMSPDAYIQLALQLTYYKYVCHTVFILNHYLLTILRFVLHCSSCASNLESMLSLCPHTRALLSDVSGLEG